MPDGRYRLTIRESFAASHCLRHYEGKCENLHGHNFEVEVAVEGTRLDPKIEFLMDFKELRTKLKEVLGPLDHAHLNEVAPFDLRNPSSENLARHIYEQLATALPGHVKLAHVSVSEKPGQTATYYQEQEV